MSHPGVEMISDLIAETGLVSGTIAEQREAMARVTGSAPPPAGVAVETLTLGGRPAERLVPPAARPACSVLYLHGGGYCTGSLDSHRGLAGRIALAAGCEVVTLDYRLAPEDPHPAALTDAVRAYGGLLALGTRPEGVVLAGDSAGGGLTVATLVALRDDGSPLPAAAVCLSPWVDLTQTAPAYERIGARDPMITKAALDLMAAAYLGGIPAATPSASPLYADLGGLPPVLVEVGEREVLVDDATGLADRLLQAGGTVSLEVWPELIHVFQAFPGDMVPEADRSIEKVGGFISRHLPAAGASERSPAGDAG